MGTQFGCRASAACAASKKWGPLPWDDQMGPKVRRLANGTREKSQEAKRCNNANPTPGFTGDLWNELCEHPAGYRGGNHEAHLFFRLSGRDEDRGGYGAPGLPSPMVQLPLEAAQLHAGSFAPQAALETHAVRGQSRGAQKLGLGQTALVASTRSTSREGSQNPVAWSWGGHQAGAGSGGVFASWWRRMQGRLLRNVETRRLPEARWQRRVMVESSRLLRFWVKAKHQLRNRHNSPRAPARAELGTSKGGAPHRRYAGSVTWLEPVAFQTISRYILHPSGGPWGSVVMVVQNRRSGCRRIGEPCDCGRREWSRSGIKRGSPCGRALVVHQFLRKP